MTLLGNGTVVPSTLGLRRLGGRGNSGASTNTSLRWGEVKEVIYPSDSRSQSRRWREYNVSVWHKDGNEPGACVIYNNCVLANAFGGLNGSNGKGDAGPGTTATNSLSWALVADTEEIGKSKPGNGSKVLLECPNGDTHNAVIVGGIPDAADHSSAVEDQAWGHYYRLCYNGACIAVNDAGELTLLYQGQVKSDGTLDPSAQTSGSGSGLSFRKNGDVVLQGPSGKLPQNPATTTTIAVGAPSLTLSAADGKVKIATAGGLKVGSATDAMVLGTTYRKAEAQANTQAAAQAQALQAAMTQLAAQLTAAAAAVASAAPAAGPPLIAAGAAAVQAAAAFTAWASALQTLEAQSQTYLSQRHGLGDG